MLHLSSYTLVGYAFKMTKALAEFPDSMKQITILSVRKVLIGKSSQKRPLTPVVVSDRQHVLPEP